MKPSVGRIVHYVSRGSADGEFPSKCRAAIITEVWEADPGDDNVSLAVLNPSGLFFDQAIVHDEIDKSGGTWHWPEQVEE